MQALFRPFCPHSLIPVQLEKQLVTSLRATQSRGNIYILLRFRYPQGWESAPGTGSFSLVALWVLLHTCSTRLSGGMAGKRLAPLCSVPAWSLWSLLYHPSHSEVSLSDSTFQYVVFNVKFEVQGFSSPYTRSVCLKAGVDLRLLIQGPNSAHSHSWTAEAKVQTSGLVCRYVEYLWHISYLTDGKPVNTSEGLMHQC